MQRRSFLAGVSAAAALLTSRTATPQGRVPILDTHLHPIRSLRRSSGGINVSGVLRTMDQFGVQQAILLPPPFDEQGGRAYGLADLAAAVRGEPRLAFTAGGEALNPMLHDTPPDRVTADKAARFTAEAEKIAAAGAAAFGEIAVEHFSSGRGNHPYESTTPDHPLLRALAYVGARHGMPLEIHMEAVPQDMPFPADRPQGPNPASLRANIAAFERLLAHNRQARIVWAHAGWDLIGTRTPRLMQELLQRHTNLYMNIKSDQAGAASTAPLGADGRLKPDWASLLRAAPDRFMIGSDQFITDGTTRLEYARRIVDALPPDLAQAVANGNARRVYRVRF